jgi:UDP-glucose 4-epimerase
MIQIKKAVVTGCAGFVGSSLVDHLLTNGISVVGLDNLSTGNMTFLQKAKCDSNFVFHEVDILASKVLTEIFEGADAIFHLAANADVRFGPEHPHKDLEQNTIATQKVLEATRLAGVKKFIFSSTGSVYGEAKVIPTPEDAPFPIQTSLYGASKLACEGLIQAYSESFGIQVWIFRFV